MSNYIDPSDIEFRLGVTFGTETSPTLAQVQEYIELAENEFELDNGLYREQTDVPEYIIPNKYGVKVNNLPINSITSIKVSNGDRITPTYSDILTTDYSVSKKTDSLILIRNPIASREYEVIYSTGYSKASMPKYIKNTVFLYTMKQLFNNHLFESNGGSTVETIDAEVYKLVTSHSAYEGKDYLTPMINEEKKKYGTRLKVYNGKRLEPDTGIYPYR